MATNIRPELSKKNPYYIDRKRFFELKYLCLQYPDIKKADKLDKRIQIIEKAAMEANASLKEHILLSVTKGYTYWNLKTMHNIPCGRKYFYEQYRKFFWLLDQSRD